jgi:hypothetical protein
MTVLEAFPPGRRRKIILYLAQHPELDAPDYHGQRVFHIGTHDGEPTVRVDTITTEKLP